MTATHLTDEQLADLLAEADAAFDSYSSAVDVVLADLAAAENDD